MQAGQDFQLERKLARNRHPNKEKKTIKLQNDQPVAYANPYQSRRITKKNPMQVGANNDAKFTLKYVLEIINLPKRQMEK